MSKVLITGASGFIGQYLSQFLCEKDFQVTCAYRSFPKKTNPCIADSFSVGEINSQTQWQASLKNIDVVIHLAARVHVMKETDVDPFTAFHLVNTQGTFNLAKQAVEAGVKRFIYISSIKVNGEQTDQKIFSADDEVNPQDPYALSKFKAEQKLLALAQETGLEIVIIRPPLVYGGEAKGNFSRLVKLVRTGFPLPLAGINNARSFVNVQNLCSLIHVCLAHPKAANEVFLVSDGLDLSTSELLEQISLALGKNNHLFYLPKQIIWLLTYLLGRRAEYERLFGSLQVDILKNKQVLNWEPVVTVKEGIVRAVK